MYIYTYRLIYIYMCVCVCVYVFICKKYGKARSIGNSCNHTHTHKKKLQNICDMRVLS